jgi:hypothetical protein
MGRGFKLPVEEWSCGIVFKHNIKESKKGEKVGHSYLKIGDRFYDFTARQADPDCPFPVVRTTPYPGSTRSTKEPELRDDFWYQKLWKAFDS